MSDSTRERIPIFLDVDLKAEIKAKHAKTKGFFFQTVGEELFKAWSACGMPYPVSSAFRSSQQIPPAEVDLALHVLDILREDREHPVWGAFHDGVIAEAERRLRAKTKR